LGLRLGLGLGFDSLESLFIFPSECFVGLSWFRVLLKAESFFLLLLSFTLLGLGFGDPLLFSVSFPIRVRVSIRNGSNSLFLFLSYFFLVFYPNLDLHPRRTWIWYHCW